MRYARMVVRRPFCVLNTGKFSISHNYTLEEMDRDYNDVHLNIKEILKELGGTGSAGDTVDSDLYYMIQYYSIMFHHEKKKQSRPGERKKRRETLFSLKNQEQYMNMVEYSMQYWIQELIISSGQVFKRYGIEDNLYKRSFEFYSKNDENFNMNMYNIHLDSQFRGKNALKPNNKNMNEHQLITAMNMFVDVHDRYDRNLIRKGPYGEMVKLTHVYDIVHSMNCVEIEDLRLHPKFISGDLGKKYEEFNEKIEWLF